MHNEQTVYSILEVRRNMIKRKKASILVSTLMFFAVLSGVFIFQNMALNSQLTSRSQMITLTKIDKIQLEASLNYHKNNQKIYQHTDFKVTVKNDSMTINFGNNMYTRELLMKTP